MSGFLAFLSKELLEIVRTWRIWVLPGILLAVGLSSPVLAAISPWLIESATSEQPGMVIQIPDPVAVDAYIQWVQQLQIVLLALIIVTAGLVSGERRSGTAVLVLTKPVSRAAFIAAKYVAQMVLVIAAAIVSAIACWAVTLAVFGEAPLGGFTESVLIFLALAAFIVAIMLLCSTVVNTQAGAAGLGLLAYLVASILSGWGPARDYSPAGLFSAVGAVLTRDNVPVLGPAIATIVATALILALTIAIFTRQEQATRLGAG